MIDDPLDRTAEDFTGRDEDDSAVRPIRHSGARVVPRPLTARAASTTTSANAPGWETVSACEAPLISTVAHEPAGSAMKRCAAAGMG
ncbi:hypothetical protein ACWDYH_07730 [Nocardia goodfellowii]